MTARSLVACAVVSLAVAIVPLAAAAGTKPKHHAVVVRVAHATDSQIYRAPFPSTPIRTPRYIYLPAAPPTSSWTPSGPTCMYFEESCSPAEMCQYWGENC